MQPILTSVPALAVSAIYCLWHIHWRLRLQRVRLLHERMAYMLWVMANRVE
jgi:hypothetical protein